MNGLVGFQIMLLPDQIIQISQRLEEDRHHDKPHQIGDYKMIKQPISVLMRKQPAWLIAAETKCLSV